MRSVSRFTEKIVAISAALPSSSCTRSTMVGHPNGRPIAKKGACTSEAREQRRRGSIENPYGEVHSGSGLML
jgi:hypothetical protein